MLPSTYSVLRPILRFALDLYYVDIQVVGGEAIPDEGPLIIAANHPNSLMDTVLLGTQTPRQIHYLARSGLFESRIGRAIFRRLGAIPIYRPEDHPALQGETLQKQRPTNDATFAAVYEVLDRGGCVGIFPEGRNSPDGQVAPFRSGVARMAFGAEDRHDFELGLRIVPVGIHFERRDRFFTGVLLRVGRPITVASRRDAWETDPREAARDLTEELQHAIRQEALHIVDARRNAFVRDLSDILGERLIDSVLGRLEPPRQSFRKRFFNELRHTPDRRRDLDDEYQIRQYIGDVIDGLAAQDPDALDELERRIRQYTDHVDQARLRHVTLPDEDVSRMSSARDALRLTTYAVAFAPLAFWGLVNHVLPWLAVHSITRRVRDEATRAITLFVSSLLGFPLFYVLQGWAMWKFQETAMTWIVLYLLTLPLAGFFWLRYLRQLLRYRDRLLARTLVRSRKGLQQALARERRLLVAYFEEQAARTGVSPPGEAAAIRLDAFSGPTPPQRP